MHRFSCVAAGSPGQRWQASKLGQVSTPWGEDTDQVLLLITAMIEVDNSTRLEKDKPEDEQLYWQTVQRNLLDNVPEDQQPPPVAELKAEYQELQKDYQRLQRTQSVEITGTAGYFTIDC